MMLSLIDTLTPEQRLCLTSCYYDLGNAAGWMAKSSSDASIAHVLKGRLYLSQSGWLLLSVPNALVRGAFDALGVIGAELPIKEGTLNAHITVMRPEEIEQIGGPDAIVERGSEFAYTLGPVRECEPAGWPEMAKVWFIEISSPDLKKLRQSYGLPPFPKHPFHCTVAVRRKGVLYDNDVVKGGNKAAGLITREDLRSNSEKYEREIRAAVAKAAAETDTDPSEEQKKAGNYRKGKFWWNDLEVAIETPRGAVRSGTGKDGKKWSVTMAHHYGYLKQTESEADGDHIDVFIGPEPERMTVYVIDQVDPETGEFDEAKCLLGFSSKEDAEQGYLDCYEKGWKGLKECTTMSLGRFKIWLEDGDTSKPLSDQPEPADKQASLLQAAALLLGWK